MSGDSSRGSFLSIIQSCDNFPYDAATEESYYKLFLPGDDQPHGYLLRETVRKMPWTPLFRVARAPPRSRSVSVLDSSRGADTAAAVTAALAELVSLCVAGDLFHVLAGRHSEPVALASALYPVQVERFASALLGVTLRGAHLVAYTRSPSSSSSSDNDDDDDDDDDEDEDTKLWIARRAAHLYTYPGRLDATASEEASPAGPLVRSRARSAGALTYVGATGGRGVPGGEPGLAVPNVVYVYDAELPAGVEPRPRDDEVAGFALMRVREPDAGAVLVDFLVRHGFVTAEDEEHFVEINMRLHRRLPFRTAVPVS
ncbi:hypothetical protein F5X99DRAFT_426221 [Biscogniauxia marginata]|nr:hypothetical protein F5X99DRAFT_426221 [Biscogniauxia marginata]